MNFKLEHIYGRHSLFMLCYTLCNFHPFEWSKPSINKNEILWGGGGRCSKCSERTVFFWAMTRHHAEPNNMFLRRNLPFDSDVGQ